MSGHEHCPVCDDLVGFPAAWKIALSAEGKQAEVSIRKQLLELPSEQRAAVLLMVLDSICAQCGEVIGDASCLCNFCHTERDVWVCRDTPADGFRTWDELTGQERREVFSQYPMAQAVGSLGAAVMSWHWYKRRPQNLALMEKR